MTSAATQRSTTADTAQPPLVEVRDLVVEYRQRKGPPVRAVDRVSLSIERGRTLGLVGESGSGKSTIGNAILGLVEATSGDVLLDGAPIDRSKRIERSRLARRMQVVFQDPFGSMNPTRTVGETLTEALRFTVQLPVDQIRPRIDAALSEVGMDPAALSRYPSQFSGGQLQRLAIARAVAVNPDFIVCDEAVSALDLSVQAQVINLLHELADSRKLAYLFISHDLSVVRHLSDDIAVLFDGRVVEIGPAEDVADRPAHPYSQALALAAPIPDPVQQAERRRLRLSLRREAAQPAPQGCRFAHRCSFAIDICRTVEPELIDHGSGVRVACHRAGDPDVNTLIGAENA